MQIKSITIIFLFLLVNQVNAQIKKIGIKSFLDQTISQKKYTIDILEKSISVNDYYHSLLLNKAVRFKMYMDSQEYLTKLYSANCKKYLST